MLLNQIQSTGFKKREMELQNKLIGDILTTMREAGASGAGMSSFGPYVICSNSGQF